MIVTESILDLAECTLQDVTDVSWFDIKKVIEAVAPLIRSAALEEAAKVAEAWGKREAQITDTAFIPAADNGEQFASVGIASAIRSLKDKTND